jgi:hypothetical protein
MIRLGRALEAHPASRTLFFCVSKKHALFTRDWLREMGAKAAAVFSGLGSDSYALSLAGLQSGALDSLCVVDMFNEGLDIPAVDRVVMLRPTESKVVFLQQLGRGLRAAGGKERLLVIDFVGNHRIFAQRMVHLLSLRCARAGFEALRRWIERGELDLPEGCLLDVELEAKDLLHRLLPSGKTAALDGYRALRDELGRRPLMVEVFHGGFLPKTLGEAHGGWFSFLRAEGDLTQDETAAFDHLSGWFTALEKTALNKSYKMVVVRVLLDLNALWQGVLVSELARACRRFLRNHPVLSRDLQGENHALDHVAALDAEWTEWWRQWPLERWQQPIEGVRWFKIEDDRFVFTAQVSGALRRKFEDLSAEIVDYRLAHYARSRRMDGISVGSATSLNLFRCKVSHSNQVPILRLDRSRYPAIPSGPTEVEAPDGSRWDFKFVKVAVNVAHVKGGNENQLFVLLREWFGPHAGLPGTNFSVRFESEGGIWKVFPEGSEATASELPPEYTEQRSPSLRVAEEDGQ